MVVNHCLKGGFTGPGISLARGSNSNHCGTGLKITAPEKLGGLKSQKKAPSFEHWGARKQGLKEKWKLIFENMLHGK